MKSLPKAVSPFNRTAVFEQHNVPTPLLHSHRTKKDIWGKIVVLEGALVYRILEPTIEEVTLTPDTYGVVEPEIRHEVIPGEGVRFFVEFLRAE